jgi:hypothetical protein
MKQPPSYSSVYPRANRNTSSLLKNLVTKKIQSLRTTTPSEGVMLWFLPLYLHLYFTFSSYFYLVCGPMLCTAVLGLFFSPQIKFMYQIYLFFTPLHCHSAKCNPDHITVLCHNWPLLDQGPTPYIELND